MRRPSVTLPHSLLRKFHIIAETLCTRKKDRLHCHDYVQLWYVFSGTVRHTLGNREYIQNPGSCVIALPYTDHAIDTLESEDTPVVLSVSFTDRFLTDRGVQFFPYFNKNARFEGLSIPLFCELEGERRKTADMHARQLLSEFSPNSEPSFDAACRHLTDFLRILCSEAADNEDIELIAERANAITAAVRYMADHLGEKIMRDDLCAVAAMSRTSFSESFKAVTGMTAKEFLLGLRIREAQQLLLFSDKSLNEIAKEVGLYDKARLTHVFYDHFGMAPMKYKELTLPYVLEQDKATRRRVSFYPKFPDSDKTTDS